MKTETKKIIGIAAITLIIGLLLGWLFFGGSENRTVDEHQHDGEIVNETIWTCSMHPQIRQNEPGDCPICGMELIPLDNNSNAELDPMAISMSRTAMLIANVGTEIVGKTKPVKLLRLNGKVQADERLVYSQSSHIPGRIEKLMVNFTGEYVNKGQVIATIYSPDLVNAQEELFEARKIVETQPMLFNSAKEKLKNWKLSDNQITQILESGTVQEELHILADVSGYVTEKKVNLGDYVNKGMPIYQIANLSTVWILFDVYESDMAWIKKGDEVSFTVQSVPGETFKGKISYLDPVIDPMTRVAKARVEVNNRDLQLKPEMFVSGTVEAKLPIKSDVIVVPKTAVMWTGKRSVVYIKNISDRGVNFMMRDVTLGPALGESFVVNEGLEEGEEIAINGTFSIDAAAQLAGKPSMMNPEGGPAMTGHNHGGTDMGGEKESESGMRSNESTDHSEMPDKTDHSRMEKRMEVSEIFVGQLEKVFDNYLELKDALVKDEASAAKKGGDKLLATLKKVDMKILTDQEAHNHWMAISKEIKSSSEAIGKTSDIEKQRGHFKHLSAHLSKGVRLFGVNNDVYEQFCPMADNNQGAYWLSTKKEIENPYMGSKMLTCGTTEATINK